MIPTIANNPLAQGTVKSWAIHKVNYYTIVLRVKIERSSESDTLSKVDEVVLKWTRRNKKTDEVNIHNKLKDNHHILQMYAGGYGSFSLHDLIPNLTEHQTTSLIKEINKADGKKTLDDQGNWTDPTTKKDQVALFLEAMDGNIEGFFKKIEEPHKTELLEKIKVVVQYAFEALKSIGVQHGDPALRNVFYRLTEQGVVFKIGDFGSSKSFDPKKSEFALLIKRIMIEYNTKIQNKRRAFRPLQNPRTPTKVNTKFKKRRIDIEKENTSNELV